MNPQNNSLKTYSPFWALGLLILTLGFLQGAYLVDDFDQRSKITVARSQMEGLVRQAQTISQTTEAVGRELFALSSTSEEAARIITEFKIQLNQPAQSK